MNNFAQLFGTNHGPVIAVLDNKDDNATITISFSPAGLGVCSLAITFGDTDENWDEAQSTLDNMTAAQACALVSKAVESMAPMAGSHAFTPLPDERELLAAQNVRLRDALDRALSGQASQDDAARVLAEPPAASLAWFYAQAAESACARMLAGCEAVLSGIEDVETGSELGWWETSTGAAMGAEKLALLRALPAIIATPSEQAVIRTADILITGDRNGERQVTHTPTGLTQNQRHAVAPLMDILEACGWTRE